MQHKLANNALCPFLLFTSVDNRRTGNWVSGPGGMQAILRGLCV